MCVAFGSHMQGGGRGGGRARAVHVRGPDIHESPSIIHVQYKFEVPLAGLVSSYSLSTAREGHCSYTVWR